MAKFFITTLGCQMNKNDSERIVGLLLSRGFELVDVAGEADLLVINTCSVRQSAEDRVFGLVREWQKIRKKNPELIIAITGCMPGRDKDGKIKNKLSGVDLFFGIEALNLFPSWLFGLRPGWFSFGEKESGEDYLKIDPARQENFRVFITVQTGCNNFCTYCAVPLARGRERNRPLADILQETKLAIKKGVKEITFLGQVINNYKISDRENISSANPFFKNDDFASLLWEINNLEGDFRVNFTAADPQYFNDHQIKALTLPKQVNYLHLPAQSGDNEILKKMNRKYLREKYLEIVKKIKLTRPEIALGTDFIVGFCGELDEQFANTLDLYKQCEFDISYHAQYSERGGTAAAKAFKDDVPKETKKQRWEALQTLMEEITFKKNKKYLGKTLRVLVDKCVKGVCSGTTDELKLAQFPGGPELIGQFVKIEINFTDVWVLRGGLVKNKLSKRKPEKILGLSGF